VRQKLTPGDRRARDRARRGADGGGGVVLESEAGRVRLHCGEVVSQIPVTPLRVCLSIF
jgi:hypothetical protein